MKRMGLNIAKMPEALIKIINDYVIEDVIVLKRPENDEIINLKNCDYAVNPDENDSYYRVIILSNTRFRLVNIETLQIDQENAHVIASACTILNIDISEEEITVDLQGF